MPAAPEIDCAHGLVGRIEVDGDVPAEQPAETGGTTEAGADGVTVLNTMPAMAIDIDKGSLFIRGGLSGPPLKPMALKAVSDISKAISLPVIGAGGIVDYRDALAFLMAGARMVQVGTATFLDPFAIPKIVRGLDAYMEEHSLSRLAEITGIAGC